MNRQSINKTQKPKNSTLLPSTNILQRKLNRIDFSTSTVGARSLSGQQIGRPNHTDTESKFNNNFSKIPVRLNSQSFPIQAKLKIGQPNDKYEQEADRVAEQVMRMPEPRSSSVGDSSLTNSMIPRGGTIQRSCATCSAEYKTTEDESRPVEPANLCPKCRTQEGLIQTKQIIPLIQRQEDLAEVEEEDEELIQAKTTGAITPEVTPAISSGIQSLQGGGRPLSGSERSFFEPRFGADFSSVRVHNDTRAANAARSVYARAFTHGHNVVFGAGEYSSDSLAGRKLLAHELTHVVQQNEGMIHRQEQPDFTVNQDISPDPDEKSAPRPTEGSTRVNRCYTNPEFPNFPCLVSALKLDIDENLRNNAHQFYRSASLFPDDNERMWNTFQRYGLGINLLQTSFGFFGANETLGTVLSFGTGVGLKSFDLFQNGVLELDIPIPLGRDVNLGLQLDFKADPNNLSNITSASAGVGISGSF